MYCSAAPFRLLCSRVQSIVINKCMVINLMQMIWHCIDLKFVCMQEDVMNRVNEIEKLKQDFKQKEIMWLTEIERLELANEQLAEGPPDSDLQQLQMEVISKSLFQVYQVPMQFI